MHTRAPLRVYLRRKLKKAFWRQGEQQGHGFHRWRNCHGYAQQSGKEGRKAATTTRSEHLSGCIRALAMG